MQGQRILILALLLVIGTVCSKALEFTFQKTTFIRQKRQLSSKLRFLVPTQEDENDIQWDDANSHYLATIEVGTPAQTFVVEIDTGSDLSWIPSTNCTECNDSPQRFNETLSTSFVDTDQDTTINDDDGNVQGSLVKDTIKFGDLSTEGFGFVLADSLEKDYDDYKSGKLSLSYDSSQGPDFSFLDLLKNNSVIQRRIFALSWVNDTIGKFYLGDFPPEVEANMKKVSVCEVPETDNLGDEYKNGWVCELSHGLIGAQSNFNNTFEIDGFAYFDSADQYIYAPKKYLSIFRDQFINENLKNCTEKTTEDSETYFQCPKETNTIREVDDVSFILGGFAHEIPAEELFSENGDNYEFLIRFNNDDQPVWSFGQVFLSQFTTVFNKEDDEISFFGGNRFNFTEEVESWEKASDAAQAEQMRFLYTVAGGVLGGILVLLIIFLIFRALRKPTSDEHKPFINEKSKAPAK
jgi:hypothetical protein